MYGFQSEPTPLEANNLARLSALRAQFPGHRLGFMDHAEAGTEAAECLALLALPYGVVAIEKHMTLDRELELEDYVSALSPSEFGAFVERIRALEPAIGSESLELSEVEYEYRSKAMKVVVARRLLPAGEVITKEDLALKRTGDPVTDLCIHRIEDVAGRIARVEIDENQLIGRDMMR